MTAIGTTARCCVNLQQALDTMHQTSPDRDRNKNGTLEALRSEANREGVEVAQATSNLRNGAPDGVNECKMEILFEMPDCVAADQSEIDICQSVTSIGDTRGYLEQNVTLYSGRAGTWTLAEFDCICEKPDERLAKTIMKLKRSIDADMEAQIIDAIATNALSNYHDGVDSTDVAGGNTQRLNIVASTSHINAGEWSKLKSEYRKQFANSGPIVVGGDILAQYQDIRIAGLGANAVGHGNVDSLVPGNYISYALDTEVDTALGAPGKPADTSYAISWMPGAMQLLEYMDNQDYKEYFYPKSTRTVLNIGGVLYDWYIKFEECDSPHYVFKLEKRFDLFHIPEAAYTACFPSNGNLLWLLGCGDSSCPPG